MIEEIKIVGKTSNEINGKTVISNTNNNNNFDASAKTNLNISSNNNYVNTEIIEKIQNEIKIMENISIANNISAGTNQPINLSPNNNNNVNNVSSIKSQETQQQQQKTPIKKEVANTNNKNIERYVKKKISPYSATSHNQSYNTEKSGLAANSISMNNSTTPKEPNPNNNNLNITATQNKYILSKLSSAANRKNGPKTAFFNTSMSFDQNNDTKNTTFDNELLKKYENNNNNNRDKSDEKNFASSSLIIKNANAGNANNKKFSTTEIANAIKNNSIINSNANTNNSNANAKNKNSGSSAIGSGININSNNNNENYLIKKAANKKFDTIREEDEDVKTHKKPFSYLNYYTKYAPEAKNHRVNQNLISAYNADSNYPTNSITATNNNNANNANVNNTYNQIGNGNTSILKKITKRFNNESSFLEQYVTNNKKMLSSSYASSPNKKTSVSPVLKNGANSSRVQNATNNANTSVGKDIYTIKENAFSSSLTKSKFNGTGFNTSSNNNANTNNENMNTNTTSNFNNTGKNALYNNSNNNTSSNVNTYASNTNNKTDMVEFHKKIRQKNISVPNAAKFITGNSAVNKLEASKFKKINNNNITNLEKYINTGGNNNNNNTNKNLGNINTALNYYNEKSPLKKPPVSTSMAPGTRKSVTASSKNKIANNLNNTGNSVILNNSARKTYGINPGKLRGTTGAKATDKINMNLNLTTDNFNNTLVTEDNHNNLSFTNITNSNLDVLHTRSSISNNASASVKKASGNSLINYQNIPNNNGILSNVNALNQGSVINSKNKLNVEGK